MSKTEAQRRKFNLFIVGYTMAFVLLAIIGYNVADQQVASTINRMVESHYFVTDLAIYDLPRISLNLANSNGQSTRVRIDISLEVAKQDLGRLEGFRPRITDRVIAYMREQNIDDLTPPSAMRGLHEDLLKEVDNASRPIPVRDVIFRQFLVM